MNHYERKGALMDLTTRTADPTTLTLEDLDTLEAILKRLLTVIDDEHCVPGRYENTTAGTLASFDAEHLLLSLNIVQRLARMMRYPGSEVNYFAKPDAVASRRADQ